jgi:hypothetical protein
MIFYTLEAEDSLVWCLQCTDKHGFDAMRELATGRRGSNGSCERHPRSLGAHISV